MGIANAGSSVSFDVSAPQIKKAGDITITIGPDGEKGTPYTVHVNPDMKAADKANAIASVLGTPSGPFTVDYKSGSSTVKLTNMPAVSDVSFDVGTTGSGKTASALRVQPSSRPPSSSTTGISIPWILEGISPYLRRAFPPMWENFSFHSAPSPCRIRRALRLRIRCSN